MLLLVPLAGLFILLAGVRRIWQRCAAVQTGVPVVVVGNITVGGTGKTPLIIALVKLLQAAGFEPGVISRGYGVNLTQSQLLLPGALASDYGDEPVLIANTTDCVVAVGPDRRRSTELLVAAGCNIVLSDDGLQHYRLHRDREIAVIDGVRGLGNGWRLPVGPLRESPQRLRRCDWVVVNGGEAWQPLPVRTPPVRPVLGPVAWRNVRTGEVCELETLELHNAVAVAGIGHPQRFFDTLQQLHLTPECHVFPDHHAFTDEDFQFVNGRPLIMTEKDAVKCQQFAHDNWWALQIELNLPQEFKKAFLAAARQLVT